MDAAPGLAPDARPARSYAALFAMLDKGIASGRPSEAERTRQAKATLIQKLESARPKIQVTPRVKNGVAQDEVAQVTVKRQHARTSFSPQHPLAIAAAPSGPRSSGASRAPKGG